MTVSNDDDDFETDQPHVLSQELENLENAIQDRPLMALVVAAAIGFVLGRILL
jgi:ElaB/YqjD/DUF883 family membrane-anchored ribosome-binding protein